MRFFTKLPEEVEAILLQRGANPDELLYCIKADLDGEGRYLDLYLTFDHSTLYLIKGLGGIERVRSNGYLRPTFQFQDYEEVPLSSISKASMERLVNSGRMVLTNRKGEERQLCRFSIALCDPFEKFCERLTNTITGEPIDDTYLSDRRACCPKCHNPYPQKDRRVCPYCAKRGAVALRLLKLYSRFKKEAVTIAVAVTLTALFQILAPFLGSKLLYDEVLDPAGGMYGQIAFVVLLIVGVRIISTLLQSLYGVVVSIATQKVNQNLRVNLLDSMQRLSLSYFTSKQTGSLMSRVDNDAMYIYSFFVDLVPYTIVNLVSIVCLLIVMFQINVLLTTLLLGTVLAIGGIVVLFERRQEKFYRRHHIAYKAANSVVTDSLNGQRVVKAFSKEEQEIQRYGQRSHSLADVTKGIGDRNVKNYSKVWLIYRVCQTLLFGLGAFFIITGDFTLGSLTVLISYGNMILDSLAFFMFTSNYMARCVDAGARMFEILDAEPTVAERQNPVRVGEMKGHIRFERVTFAYEPGRPIVKNLTMEIQPGQFFGIVGKTGAGKTTLINLCSRLYDPTEGEIYIDGVNVKDIAFEDLRHNIGVVSQETYLFMGTIADNIRYARPEATIDEVMAAAKAAYAHDFITKLADGYDTRVGSGGVNLSGGEKQRISIARAILQQPSILVLDEATAAMDTQTERKIQAAITQLREGKTILSIAHRLSTLRDADMLAVIEKGQLVEKGTHEELLQKKGKYFDLYRVQSEALQFVEME